MPIRNDHLKFDVILEQRRVISTCWGSERIHKYMDKGIQKHGHWNHRNTDPKHTLEGVKQRLHTLASSYNYEQHILTAHLRIACGHICLDEAQEELGYVDFELLAKRALSKMKNNGWDKTYYRHTNDV